MPLRTTTLPSAEMFRPHCLLVVLVICEPARKEAWHLTRSRKFRHLVLPAQAAFPPLRPDGLISQVGARVLLRSGAVSHQIELWHSAPFCLIDRLLIHWKFAPE